MSGGASATTIMMGASLAMTAAGTAMSVKGQADAKSAAAGAAGQSQAMGVYQQQQMAAAQSAQAGWERSLAQQRKEIATRAIDDSLQRGEVAVKIQDQTNLATQQGYRQVEGTQRARLAGSGTDLSGSAGDVLGDTAAMADYGAKLGAFDVLNIRSNATREAYGHRLELVNATNDENLAQAKQDNAKPGMVAIDYKGSGFGAAEAGSLLAGASNLSEKWWRFQQAGGFGGGSSFTDTSYGGAGGLGKSGGTTFG